jgi:hypothetical protein
MLGRRGIYGRCGQVGWLGEARFRQCPQTKGGSWGPLDNQPCWLIVVSQQRGAEEDGLDPVVDRLEANEFTDEGFAQEEQAPPRLDLAAGARAADLDMAGIVEVGQQTGAGAGCRGPERRRQPSASTTRESSACKANLGRQGARVNLAQRWRNRLAAGS